MSVEVKVGQVRREGYSPDHWTDWRVVEIIGSEIRMAVVASTTSWSDKIGELYPGTWPIHRFAEWKLISDGNSYTRIVCASCDGSFVIPPGGEFSPRCDDCS